MDIRNFTPPVIARRYGVATAKVIGWIRTGELAALNLAQRGCKTFGVEAVSQLRNYAAGFMGLQKAVDLVANGMREVEIDAQAAADSVFEDQCSIH